MEKRMIFAFVLSFLILMVWSYLFAPKKEQTPTVGKPVQKKEQKTLSKSPQMPVLKPTISPKVDQKEDTLIKQKIEEKEIKVETPLYKARFSSAGATIKSFKLKRYHLTKNPDSPLIELFSLQENDGDFLELDFDTNSNPNNKKIIYQVKEDSIYLGPESSPKELTFSSITSEGFSLHKTFRFYPDRYDIDLLIKLVNTSEKQLEGNFRAQITNAPPKDKKSYYSFVGVALLLNDELEEIEPKKMKEKKDITGKIEWMAYEDDYFLSAIIPKDKIEGRFEGRLLTSGILNATYIMPSIALKSSEQISSQFTLYLGPRDLDILKQMGKKLDLAINFGWTDIIAKPLHYALRFFNRYVNNFGVSIIILTILIKIIFWPLTHKSYKSMKEMQKLQPLMAKIREKYKDNREQMNKELMGLYKTYKVNPMGGCLPMVIQIPVFFALFRILGNSIELRHAPFILWVNDLSAPDRLFNFPFQIPFMSPPYGIPVLTLLMGASMFIQQKMTPTPGDPTQAKIMMFLPVIFTVMFINFPSGLVLYWLTNNLLSIGQQYRIKKSSA